MNDLIQKMKSELNKGVVTASVTSSTMIEVTKLNTYISGLKASRNETLLQLGALVYELERQFRTNDAEAKKALIDKLIDTDQKIQEREEQIEKLKNDKNEILSGIGRSSAQAPNIMTYAPTLATNQNRCAICGAALKTTAKFCGGCGSSMDIAMLPKDLPTQEREILRCSCGEELRYDAQFCGKCGTTVQAATTEDQPAIDLDSSTTEPLTTEPAAEIEGANSSVQENVCNSCGNTLKTHARFCGRCGTPQEA